jgi:hypothetical protein
MPPLLGGIVRHVYATLMSLMSFALGGLAHEVSPALHRRGVAAADRREKRQDGA